MKTLYFSRGTQLLKLTQARAPKLFQLVKDLSKDVVKKLEKAEKPGTVAHYTLSQKDWTSLAKEVRTPYNQVTVYLNTTRKPILTITRE